MGVTALWTVVSPTARPTSLASLNRKRLAVDASIWIYQFLKAVRDKEGNALRNSHVVGFFRRICKLLYFGIKPVFVFDGGAPVLKRETVRKRRVRREGRREDAVKTAGKLLAVQMERVLGEEREKEKKRREGRAVREEEDEDIGDEGKLVYVDELGMGEAERKKGRAEGFKRRDQYHLPDLDVRIEDMGAPNDPRIMSQAELEEYARQFHSGEDINLYDFSKIDFESPFFLSLPAGDRYNILNAARLRSRLRMGYTKDQLNGMFPDRMAFSKFQIERVKERNELTQRLMHINGMGDEWESGGRIAGEKGKEYVLVKNDGVEGGWALGVVSNKLGTSKTMAIDVDEDDDLKSEEEDSDEFEDVEIEGLNRLPKSWKRKRARSVDYDYSYEDAAEQIAKKRRAVYDARKAAAQDRQAQPVVPPLERVDQSASGEADSLFVPQDQPDEDDDLFEDVDIGQVGAEEEDDDLQKAIAMSLEQPTDNRPLLGNAKLGESDDNDDDAFDMGAALAESRRTKHQPKTAVRNPSPKPKTDAPKFSGPLPFESLNLGQSLLGKKKSKKVEENLSGGFDRDLGQDSFRKERPPQPMPSWFDAAAKTKDMKRMQEMHDGEDGEDHVTHDNTDRSRREILHRHPTKEVIDLEADGSTQPQPSQIELSSDSEVDGADIDREPEAEPEDWQLPEHEDFHEDVRAERERKAEEEAREARYALAREIAGESDMPEEAPVSGGNAPEGIEKNVVLEPEGAEVPSMSEVAERAKEKPPFPTAQPNFIPSPPRSEEAFDYELEDDDDEEVDWSASETGSPKAQQTIPQPQQDADDEEDEFEDVPMTDFRPPAFLNQESTSEAPIAPPPGDAANYLLPAEDDAADPSSLNNNDPSTNDANNMPIPEDDFSDSDEELMRQLAIEVEEHARFTNSLTNPHKTTSSSTNTNNNNNDNSSSSALRDYEAELKQLRSHQKSSLRDADEVTSTMISECQTLLSLFGLPYITAPMEAEAQCAELVHLGLVDGIVTDDSDIFLFGGTRIYKNMFNAAKFVECYLASDLEKEYTLTRNKLIQFAHLLGSDYTEGIPGVGPVTALEILTEFEDLAKFRDWLEAVQRAHRPADLEGLLSSPFKRKFKTAAQKRVFLPHAFPDARVDAAYLQPEVDSDPEQFQWGVPDLEKLRGFLMATIGWSQERTDEVLVPVIRDMNRRGKEGTQANITRWFEGGVGVGADSRARAGGGGRGINGQNGSGGVAAGSGKGSAAGNAALAAVAGIDPMTEDASAGLGQRNRTGKESGRMKNAYRKLRGEAERKRRGSGDGAVIFEESGVPRRRTDEEDEEGGEVDVEAEAPAAAAAASEKNDRNKGKGKKKSGVATSKVKRIGTASVTPSIASDNANGDDNDIGDDSGDDDEAADDESFKPAKKKKSAARGRGSGRRQQAA